MNTPLQSYQPSSAEPFERHFGTQPPQPLPRGFSRPQPTHAPLSEHRGGQSLSLTSEGLPLASVPPVTLAAPAVVSPDVEVALGAAPVPAAGGVDVLAVEGEQP